MGWKYGGKDGRKECLIIQMRASTKSV